MGGGKQIQVKPHPPYSMTLHHIPSLKITNFSKLLEGQGTPMKNAPLLILKLIDMIDKVLHPKYFKHLPYTVAHTIDCVCSKMLNSWFKSWVISFTFQVFWMKIH